ncbi:MAG: hypothetical protein RLZZ65_1814 [Bacteroidota bacterium]|jgi:MFS family permease
MLQRWFGPKIHLRFHYFNLLLFAVGIACSKFLMSMGLLLGMLSLLLEADFKAYYRRWSENRLLHFLLIFYLLLWVSLAWSSNLGEGLNELRRYTSLLLIPVIICARPLPAPKKMVGLFSIFIAAVAITAFVNFIAFTFFAKQLGLIDIREMSLFGSHIRFGIAISLALAVALERSIKNKVYLLLALWFLVYTYFSQVLTGYLSVCIVLFAFVIWHWLLQDKKLKVVFLLGILVISAGFFGYYISQPIQYRETCPPNQIALKQAWQKRSHLPFEGIDLRGQQLATTVERYLMSKAGCVSASGLNQLTDQDINYIELGYADVHETKGGVMARLYGLRYQLNHAHNPNDHSLLERLAYWKNASQILQQHFLLGVGIGDVKAKMQAQYTTSHSALRPDRRLRPHNYYLTTWLNTGLIGFLLLLATLYYFLRQQWQYRQLFGFLFGLVIALSFLIEDGLETQMGLTLFAFFYALYSRRVVA